MFDNGPAWVVLDLALLSLGRPSLPLPPFFTREQMVQWFDGTHLARSPAQWDPAKLAWVNGHYIKQADDGRLAALVAEQLAKRGITAGVATLTPMCALFKDRCATTVALADWLGVKNTHEILTQIQAITGDDQKAIADATAELQKLSHQMAEQLYKQTQADKTHAAGQTSGTDPDVKDGEVVDA